MKFVADKDIPDLTGKVILVTGGNIGLGRETIYQLSKHNPSHIYLAARTKSKADSAIAELKADNPNGSPITFLELDLTSFESIKKAAATFSASSDRLDFLFNNAGIMATPPGTTKEGYEIQFGTNHLGHALLTKLLLPKLKSTAASDTNADVRIVNVSSGAYRLTPREVYPLADFKSDLANTSTFTRYGYSKLANVHFNQQLAKRNPEIKCVAIHPGRVNTNLLSGFSSSYPWLTWPVKILASFLTKSVQAGTLNQLWAATAKEAKTGAFYFPVGVETNDAKIDNEKAAQELWQWTEEQLEGHA